MFGYIVPDRPELKVKEAELYKAYYCGICMAIKKTVGNIPRLGLTYDFAFLAMLLSGINGETIELNRIRCVAGPFRKKPVARMTDIIEYCAAMNLLLIYYKLGDDVRDQRNPILLPLMLFLRIRSWIVFRKYKTQSEAIKMGIQELISLEKRNVSDIDLLTNAFGKITEQIFDYRSFDENSRKSLRWLGFNLGKWIYLLDASDDLKKDIKHKSFNPLKSSADEKGDLLTDEVERIKNYLFSCLDEASAAYELLEIKQNSSIIDNIMYSGLMKKTIERCAKNEKSI